MLGRTCEPGVVFHVFPRAREACDAFFSAMARAGEFYIAVLYMYVRRRC